MGRRRKREARKHQFCLRLTDRQLELLKEYTLYRNMETEVDAIRYMIDGLESWLAKRQADPPPIELHQSEHHISARDSGLSDVMDDDVDGPSLSDFGGMPHIGIPGMQGNDDP